MGKKNPYITTIGFDKTDPRHVQVAELLNSMTRKKAQYIVDAIFVYQRQQEQGSAPMEAPSMDYSQIKTIVLQVLTEQRDIEADRAISEHTHISGSIIENQEVEELPEEFEVEVRNSIMSTLEAFRQ